jgi:cytidyltransferase-like protein
LEKRRVLGAVFAVGLRRGVATPRAVAQQLDLEPKDIKGAVERLTKSGYLQAKEGEISLTRKGRKGIRVVFIGGGFEVIHQGHLHTIMKAKSLGDLLVVSVARDSTIRRRKKREPLAGESARVQLLSALRPVDVAILGVRGDIYKTLERVRPDVVALGYDQYHVESEVAREAKKRGMKLEVVRLDSPYPKVKTSGLLRDC